MSAAEEYIAPHMCPICDNLFEDYPDMRRDAVGRYWCKPCQDEHDNIDWDKVAERRLDQNGS